MVTLLRNTKSSTCVSSKPNLVGQDLLGTHVKCVRVVVLVKTSAHAERWYTLDGEEGGMKREGIAALVVTPPLHSKHII